MYPNLSQISIEFKKRTSRNIVFADVNEVEGEVKK